MEKAMNGASQASDGGAAPSAGQTSLRGLGSAESLGRALGRVGSSKEEKEEKRLIKKHMICYIILYIKIIIEHFNLSNYIVIIYTHIYDIFIE